MDQNLEHDPAKGKPVFRADRPQTARRNQPAVAQSGDNTLGCLRKFAREDSRQKPAGLVQQAGMNHRAANRGLGRLGHRHHRQAHVGAHLAEQRKRIFHRRRIGLDEQVDVQRHQLVLKLQRPGIIAALTGILEFRTEPRRHIGGHRNAAVAAMGVERQRRAVLTRELVEALAKRGALLRCPHRIGGRVLHPGDVLQVIQPLHGLDGHVDHRAAGDVVDDDRNADRVVDRLEVLIEPFLGRLVVVRRDHQHRRRAGLLRMLRQSDRFGGRVGTGAGDHRHPPPGLVDAPLDHALMLVVIDGWALAGGPHRHQAMSSLGDLPVDELAESGLVQRPVFKRCHQGSVGSPEIRLACHVCAPTARAASSIAP